MDRTNEVDFNIQYQRYLDEDRLENAMAMRMRQLECLLVVGRVYLGVADVGDAKNHENESENAPRCTRRDTREYSHTRMVWGWESIGEPTRIHVYVYDNAGQKLH
jgi:hypothetical protein